MLFLFLIYIKANHIVSTVKQLAADDILLFIAICYNLNPDLKANLNGNPSLFHSVQI